jgi:hypothetical protein
VNATKGPGSIRIAAAARAEMEEAYPVLKRDYPLNEKNLDWWARTRIARTPRQALRLVSAATRSAAAR